MADSTSHNKRDWSRSVGLIATLVLALLMFVGFVVLFGAVHGEEFSPTNFARRSFVFYRIPIVKIQVTPVVRNATTNPLETHLAAQYFAEPQPTDAENLTRGDKPSAATATPRWDIVRITPLSRAPKTGSAYCLCAYLDRGNGKALKWLEWSKANKKLAEKLWPIVRQAAIDRLYFCVPELMSAAEDAAERGSSGAKLQRQLQRIVENATNLRRAARSNREPGPAPPDAVNPDAEPQEAAKASAP